VPPIDRFMLREEAQPVRVEGSRGALSHAQSAKLLDDLKRRSPETGVLDRHLAVEEALTDTPLSLGNKATLLEDGEATYNAMLAAIRGARSHVHMEMYIIDDDDVGRLFADALMERAAKGAAVRLLYDSVGCIKTPKEYFERLRQGGVQVAEFNPVKSVKSLDLLGMQNRDHRKLVLVDGRVAFLGGINISGVYGSVSPGRGGSRISGSSSSAGSGGNDPSFADRPWRDTQVRLEGPVVLDLQRAFVAHWEQWSEQKVGNDSTLYPTLKSDGPHMVRAIATSPTDKTLNASYLALISAIESAETEVLITNAYFVPHPELARALEAAARRGVDVKLMLPSRTDNAVVYHAGRASYATLLEAGVRIYERKDRLLHSKAAVIDGVWSTVGSSNLDWRSLAYNDELNAVVLGTDFAVQMKTAFLRDVANSDAITHEDWQRRPFAERMKEAGASLLSRWL
jgi:cardiolipin synthase